MSGRRTGGRHTDGVGPAAGDGQNAVVIGAVAYFVVLGVDRKFPKYMSGHKGGPDHRVLPAHGKGAIRRAGVRDSAVAGNMLPPLETLALQGPGAYVHRLAGQIAPTPGASRAAVRYRQVFSLIGEGDVDVFPLDGGQSRLLRIGRPSGGRLVGAAFQDRGVPDLRTYGELRLPADSVGADAVCAQGDAGVFAADRQFSEVIDGLRPIAVDVHRAAADLHLIRCIWGIEPTGPFHRERSPGLAQLEGFSHIASEPSLDAHRSAGQLQRSAARRSTRLRPYPIPLVLARQPCVSACYVHGRVAHNVETCLSGEGDPVAAFQGR